MNEFFRTLNEYPWTAIMLGVFLIIIVGIIFDKQYRRK